MHPNVLEVDVNFKSDAPAQGSADPLFAPAGEADEKGASQPGGINAELVPILRASRRRPAW
ncbi:hypothetical protein GCM10011610_38380 [Nocardia rhizosphaerihabitans]|uniref:Uncharacterized protein n=1 Tax=Nocardia rhizosphaerihabitans TaxID=1691570 RepID=A0ABQ2KKE2_9NOCA|nr:hypothetical protein GCM10011610_38380 [Nocardia rhizosphaerihabitans]